MESSSSSLLTIRDIIDFAVIYDGLSKLMKSVETRDLFQTIKPEDQPSINTKIRFKFKLKSDPELRSVGNVNSL
jgi:uncharacterized protein involved in tellurium resistance